MMCLCVKDTRGADRIEFFADDEEQEALRRLDKLRTDGKRALLYPGDLRGLLHESPSFTVRR